MSPPRHLWSGDWQQDSAELADELARRRAQDRGQPEPTPEQRTPRAQQQRPPAPKPRTPAPRPRKPRRRRLPAGTGRRVGIALAITVVTLLSAGVAFAVTSALVSGDGDGSQKLSSTHAWFGIGMANAPDGSGVTVTRVAPGSPAAQAGLQAGDVITQINNQSIQSVDGVTSALAGLVPGNQLQIQFTRDATSYSTLATLAAQPHGHP